MKKIFSVMSAMLCVAMLAMSVSAADRSAIMAFEAAMDSAVTYEYVELKGASKETTKSADGDTSVAIDAARIKLAAPSGKGFSAEIFAWNDKSEITEFDFIKDGYSYDTLTKKKYKVESAAPFADWMYSLAGTTSDSYLKDLKNLTIKKVTGGYELKYKIVPTSDFSYSYTIILDNDYMIKSIRQTNRKLSEAFDINTITKYDFVSINKAFTIDFPHDLNQYKLAD